MIHSELYSGYPTAETVNLRRIEVPTPFPVGPINLYLFEGEELTLIDTGAKTSLTLDTLRQGLARHGYEVSDIRRLIITHAHLDHFGLAGTIVAESGARVLSHRHNLYWVSEFEKGWERRWSFYARTFRRAAMPEELLSVMETGTGLMTRYADSVPVDVLLEDGDTLDLGGRTWQVLHTPGHASGLICLHQPETRVLLSSDHLLRDITSNPVLEPPLQDGDPRPRSLVEYLASLRRVEAMTLDLILPSHGEPIHDHRGLIAQRYAFHQTRLARIMEALNHRHMTAYELCVELFPNLPPLEVFLGLSEVIGHLDILEAEGKVGREERDGVVHYVQDEHGHQDVP